MLRPTDTLARYGGEEFLILLPNTDIDEAEHVLKRIQRELTRQFFMHDNERVLITFSAGVATLRPEENQAALVARADAAMYAAKKLGRNRVERG
jgi:diguanylate cyclase